MSVDIEEWSPDFIVDDWGCLNFSMILIGKRRSGKSHMTRHLYENYLEDRYDMVYIYTTEGNAEYYKEFIKNLGDVNSNKRNKYYTNIPQDLVAIQEIIIKNTKRKKLKQRPVNALVIFDDTNSRKEKYDNMILDIYTKGRHANISMVYNSQAVTLIDNTWKENTDLVFIWKIKLTAYREHIVNNILAGTYDIDFTRVRDEKIFYDNVLKKITKEQYRALVVDNNKDLLYFYTA